MKIAKLALRVVGGVAILTALFGLFYNGTGFLADGSDPVTTQELSYFYPAYYSMSAICVLCYAGLLCCGVKLLVLDLKYVPPFIAIVVFEFVYFFAVGIAWFIPNVGKSIAAATGVANGGLSVQFMILLPLWGPLLAGWAALRLRGVGSAVTSDGNARPTAGQSLEN